MDEYLSCRDKKGTKETLPETCLKSKNLFDFKYLALLKQISAAQLAECYAFIPLEQCSLWPYLFCGTQLRQTGIKPSYQHHTYSKPPFPLDDAEVRKEKQEHSEPLSEHDLARSAVRVGECLFFLRNEVIV